MGSVYGLCSSLDDIGRDLLLQVYQHIYNEEDRSSQTVATNIPGMYNRTTTQGRYGIWGHSLGELIIDCIYFDQNKGLYYISISSLSFSFHVGSSVCRYWIEARRFMS